ncbi:MAG: aspartate ammonia-lyase [Ignavibacteria bacterium]|nr:aspartate ammonia-lyase [Ignavibacteria bacterium]
METIVEFIKKVEIFKDLDVEELAALLKRLEIITYDENEYLFMENSPRRGMYIVWEGKVELYKNSPFGEPKKLTSFSKYDFLSEGALLDDYPHSTNAIAKEPTKMVFLSKTNFDSFIRESPEVASKIISQISRVISRRMRQAANQVVNAAAQYISGRVRIEKDLLGEREVPYEFYYGIQTLRALENFPITGIPISHFPDLIVALAQVKYACALANYHLGFLPENIKNAIVQACQEIIDGRFHIYFVVDMIQGGAGTSTNMNANEVIANRALEILGYERGQYQYCHPNNHVNLSQSTNDVYPTALKIAFINLGRKLESVLQDLIDSFHAKALQFSNIIKIGRTQLQDAVPMTLGQEFEAFAVTLEQEKERINHNMELLFEINLGGTAIGTGINTHPRYRNLALEYLREITGLPLKLAENLVEATQDTGAFVLFSSSIKALAIKLSKIANDLRLLSSGPRAGLNEINLPKMQPGSSIMPGKVNPVIPEVVNQVAFKVIGNDLTVTLAAEAGQLQLNVFEPVIAQSIFESIEMLISGIVTFNEKCVKGITANEKQCRAYVEKSLGIVTALNEYLGYEVTSQLAKESLETGKGIYELVLEKKLLEKDKLDEILNLENMIRPSLKSDVSKHRE